MREEDAMPTAARTDARLTYDDFLHFPEDGKRHELIDGVHYVTASPDLGHQELLGRLYLAIGNFLVGRRHLGRVFLSPLDVVLSYYDVVEPDLLFVAGDQQDILTEANVQGPPALVVETLSPSTRRRDEGIKRKLFEEKGVREYWIVDPKGLRVTVFRRDDAGQFPRLMELHGGQALQLETPLLPGFALSIDDLFAPV
ncbi:MAG: Uma2 family endonuclease [Vicinamibacterales bacterium]